MKLKAFVTGGTGYIGSNLLRFLLKEEWDLYVLTRPSSNLDNIKDIQNQISIYEYNGDITSLKSFLELVQPDVIFHLASTIISDPQLNDISKLVQGNLEFGLELLEAMKETSTRLFINTGSYWQNYNSDSYNPVDLYAATKEAFEKIIQYYVDAHQYRSITLRLFDVYGENDKRPKLLNLLKKASAEGLSIDISPAEQYIDMVHISDVCSAYLSAYELLQSERDIKNSLYGVYTGRRIRLKDMIHLYEYILGETIPVNIGTRPYRNREVMMPYSGYKKLPNWDVKISLEEGLNLLKNN